MRQDPIKIVEYELNWPAEFTREKERLEPVLAPWLVLPIEHIGSTAVPGLPAKPIIDMLAVVTDRDAFGDAMGLVHDLGWVHAPELNDETDRKWSLCFPTIAHRTHHLHVVEHDSHGWPRWLAFRDHLRANPEIAAEYALIKARLAGQDDQDRTKYRSGKAPFIDGVLRRLEQSHS